MPDRDVFSRHVPRGWQTAARICYSGLDDAVTMVKLMRALGKNVKQGGCPGIDEIPNIVADAIGSPHTAPHEGARRRLDQVNRKYVNARTEVAVESARALLAFAETQDQSTSGSVDLEQIRLDVGTRFLIEFAMRQISSPSLLAALGETDDVPVAVYLQGQQRARKLLTDSPEVGTLARQLLSSPEGDRATTPRMTIPQMTPDEMVSFALTD